MESVYIFLCIFPVLAISLFVASPLANQSYMLSFQVHLSCPMLFVYPCVNMQIIYPCNSTIYLNKSHYNKHTHLILLSDFLFVKILLKPCIKNL